MWRPGVRDNQDEAEAETPEVGVAICASLAEVLSGQLQKTAEQIEAAVRPVCRNFQNIAARARANADAHRALAGESRADPLGLALRAIAALTERLDQAQAINRRTTDYLARLGSIGAAGGRIQNALLEIDSIVSGLHILALNGRMEAARAGAHGRAFGEVAAQTSEMSRRVHTSAGLVRELLGDLHEQVHRGAAGVQKEMQGEEENARTCREQAARAMAELKQAHQQMQQAVQGTLAEGAALATDLDEAVTALQFQDAVNQQLEHATSTLGDMHQLLEDFVAAQPDARALTEAARRSGWGERLRARCTMLSERQALDRGTGPAAEQNSPAGSVELF